MRVRLAAALAALLALSLMGLALAGRLGPSPTPSSPAPAPPVATPQDESPLERTKRALQEDIQLPRYQGPLGPFVVGPTPADFPPCDEGWRLPEGPEQVARSSELFHPLLEGAFAPDAYSPYGVFGCLSPRLETYYIGAPVPGGGGVDYMYRAYFVGEARVAVEAPLSRLRLESIDGRPALVVLPVTGAIVSDAEVFIIERMPDGERPGIMVGVRVMQDVELARSLARQLLRAEVR